MGTPSSIIASLSCENTRWQSLPSMSGAGGGLSRSAILYVFAQPHELFILPSAHHSCPTKPGRVQRVLPGAAGTSGYQSVKVLEEWGAGRGLTDVTGGPGVWGLPEMPAENMHACKGTNAAGLQHFLSSRAWSLSSILRKMTAPWCDSLWGLTKSHPLFIFLCS